ncbi:MAG: glycoside hydrolase [Halobacteriales archaeon]|nr:glycoside hydrolase [Halobacteriales archaeon]
MRIAPVLLVALLAGCASTPPPADDHTTPPPAADIRQVAAITVVANGTTAPVVATDVVPALFDTGHQMGEPTIGVTKDGRIFVASDTADQAASGFRTDILRSDDGGRNWTDVSPFLLSQKTHPVTGDPMIWLDVDTGRLFDMDQIDIYCDYISSTDDNGATWTPPTPSCPMPVSDHQTIVTGKPTTIPASPLYPKIVYMCSNQLAQTQCGRSLDGGLSFHVAASPFTATSQQADEKPVECGALVGHLKPAADGTLFLPNGNCGKPVIAVTKDSMTTWTLHVVSDIESIGLDPSVAVGGDGTVYFTWVDAKGLMQMAASKDGGQSWGKPVALMPEGLTAANLPASAAGNGDRMVAFYYATDFAGGYAKLKSGKHDDATWGAYFAIVANASSAHPTITTVRLNPIDDPMFRGPCGPGRCPPGLYDFMDVQVDQDGRPWAVLVDGCQADCAAAGGKATDSTAVAGMVGTLAEGPSLLDGTPLVAIHGAKA